MLPENLGPTEVRVLGSLIEKELSTPDHYPLSLNALTAACNQSSNRDPVVSLDESAVSGAIDVLRRLSLVRSFQASGTRVPKYTHLLTDAGDLARAELAVLDVLMLRGSQTLAEVKTRAARLMPNDSPEGIEEALEALIARAPTPAATRLTRRPGQKEVRYAHLLGGEVTYEVDDAPAPTPTPHVAVDRIAALEELIHELRGDIADLQSQLSELRQQLGS